MITAVEKAGLAVRRYRFKTVGSRRVARQRFFMR
jgi:hypothetical protein